MRLAPPSIEDPDDPIVELFAREVPEIASGAVEIRAVARVPGRRAKVAVFSNDPDVDAVGACVGLRSSRIQRIVEQLDGERIDLFPWSATPERLIKLALAPAQVREIRLKLDDHSALALVDQAQLPVALGAEGLNRDLASRISGWQIEVAVRGDAA